MHRGLKSLGLSWPNRKEKVFSESFKFNVLKFHQLTPFGLFDRFPSTNSTKHHFKQSFK